MSDKQPSKRKPQAKKGLNTRRKIFVQRYILTENATQSAIDAGYSKRTAKVIGHSLLTFADVREAVDKGLRDKLTNVEQMTLDAVEELRILAHSRVSDIMDINADGVTFKTFDEMSPNAVRTIAAVESVKTTDKDGTVTVKFRMKQHSKTEALGHLFRFLKIDPDDLRPPEAPAPTDAEIQDQAAASEKRRENIARSVNLLERMKAGKQ